MHRIWKTWLGIIVGSIFLYLACRKADLHDMSLALRDARYIYLVPTVILTIGSIFIRAYRWKFLLCPIQSISFPQLFSATSVGLMANNLLPARLGEFVRAYVIGRANVNRSSAFATIVVERVLDLFVLLFLLTAIFTFFPFPDWVTKAGYLILLLAATTLVCLMLLKAYPGKAEKAFGSILAVLPLRLLRKILKLLRSFIEGLEILGDIWALMITVILSVGLWLMIALAVWSACIAFGFHLPFYAPLIILTFISVGIMIPSAPGFIGTFQFFAVKSLGLFGISGDQALSFSLAFHATQFIPITLVGLFCLWISNVPIRHALRAEV
jgi:uncharacterized protein (TIRG00374 family)